MEILDIPDAISCHTITFKYGNDVIVTRTGLIEFCKEGTSPLARSTYYKHIEPFTFEDLGADEYYMYLHLHRLPSILFIGA